MHHKDLEAWKKSIKLVMEVYEITKTFPNDERYGIVSQIRRAAVSVPSNLAEGAARSSDKEALRFFDIAIGSLAELDTQFIISENLKYHDNSDIYNKIEATKSLIIGLKKYITKKLKE